MPYTYDYPRPAVSVDMLVFRLINHEKNLLLIERLHEPYINQWALPGGFMDIDETLEDAAFRELKEETGLVAVSATQVCVNSGIDRDPRFRVISVAFEMDVDESHEPVAADDARTVKWFPVSEMPKLAFDHSNIVAKALKASDGS